MRPPSWCPRCSIPWHLRLSKFARTQVNGTTFGIVMIAIGLVMIVRGLTASHLYNDTEGPISEEELNRAVARPRDRLFAVVAGILSIGIGVYTFTKS